ncbi:unnamed protein product [Didymodactylos carnosus]|uniref:Uncharacterized protein n=1 Tax=Didymodactylos carnosus TaxID=1234261 RepID=A0A814HRL7_9BILA|nr:unnamed protein product [Didymodactylos carnosus]CAF1014368.1 unnamed protein product [Didymodactylos carnosus]CAF3602237.1 unnamed protein product [Didymodactylos carnosus]CAF3785969.1 unnamed protein product [Didymodactylos carnosus]
MATKIPCANPNCAKHIGIFACQGCKQLFCGKHSNEHRQEITNLLDNIMCEHDSMLQQLHQTMTNVLSQNSLLDQINKWENDSINSIQIAAKEARDIVEQIIYQKKEEAENDFRVLSSELKQRRENDDYVETDINEWKNELYRRREKLNISDNIGIDIGSSVPNPIKLIWNPITQQNLQSGKEKFSKVCGDIKLECNGQIAIHKGMDCTHPSVYGTNIYLDGVHEISIHVQKLERLRKWIFLGITSLLKPMRANPFSSSSANGWLFSDGIANAVECNDKKSVAQTNAIMCQKGVGHDIHLNYNINENDIVKVVLNCQKKNIQLTHTGKLVSQISVELESCPFPWQLFVSLGHTNDCIRIV